MGKELELLNDIELVLKQVWRTNKYVYGFELCCKQILKIYNPCPNHTIAFKLPKCIEICGTVFKILSIDDIAFKNQVIGIDSEINEPNIVETKNDWLLLISTDDIEHISTMCIYNIILKVTPDCMEYDLVNKCVYLSDIIELIYAEHNTQIGICFIQLLANETADLQQAIDNFNNNDFEGFYTVIDGLIQGPSDSTQCSMELTYIASLATDYTQYVNTLPDPQQSIPEWLETENKTELFIQLLQCLKTANYTPL